MWILGTAIGAGLFLFCLILLLFQKKAAGKDAVRRKLDYLSRDTSGIAPKLDDEMNKPLYERLFKPIIHHLIQLLVSVLPIKRRDASAAKQQAMIQQAGWTITVEEYNVIQLILMGLGCGLCVLYAVLSGEGAFNIVLYAVGGIFAGYAIMRFYCTSMGTKRKTSMEKQLPDMLDLLSVSVAAGLGFERAMLHIIETMDGPLIDEFAVAYREMSMGRSRKDALTLLGERCGVEELKSVTSAIVQAGQLGIPIRNVLHSQAAAIRRERRNKVQETAAKVSTKILIPMIAFIFPVLLIVLLGPSVITIMDTF